MGHSPGLILFSYTLHVPQTWNSKGEQHAGSLRVLRGSYGSVCQQERGNDEKKGGGWSWAPGTGCGGSRLSDSK